MVRLSPDRRAAHIPPGSQSAVLPDSIGGGRAIEVPIDANAQADDRRTPMIHGLARRNMLRAIVLLSIVLVRVVSGVQTASVSEDPHGPEAQPPVAVAAR
ncbi:MAG: hypothetical protein R3E87_02935 [Burkholderiaceae bacterium]